MKYKLTVSLAALLLNSLSIIFVYNNTWAFQHSSFWVVFHILASAVMSKALLPLLPEKFRTNQYKAFSLLFLVQVALPFIGSAATLFCIVLPAASLKEKKKEKESVVLDPKLKHRADQSVSASTDHGALRQILDFSSEPLDRLSAVWSASLLPEKQSVALLRVALKDSADDVRLLAYSFLDKIENRYMEKVAEIRKSKQCADASQLNYWRFQLANQYWEMVYLGISSGGVEKFFLNAAKEELECLLGDKEDKSAYFLLGRILLFLEDFSAAEEAFESALRLGGMKTKITPYLAEAYFGQKNYQKLSKLATHTDGLRSVA